MLDEIDAEEWRGWLDYWNVEPWGELRADQRAAAQALWNTAPYAGEGASLPDLTFPYFKDEGEEVAKRIAAIEKLKKDILNGRQHCKTSDPPND